MINLLNLRTGQLQVVNLLNSTTSHNSFRFTGFAFLANIGGALSLYLGVSLVSVFELFEIILRLTCYKNKTKK